MNQIFEDDYPMEMEEISANNIQLRMQITKEAELYNRYNGIPIDVQFGNVVDIFIGQTLLTSGNEEEILKRIKGINRENGLTYLED